MLPYYHKCETGSGHDVSVFNGIEQGFITGNKDLIDTLFSSKEAYRKYIGLTGKAAKKDDNAANNILKLITNPDYDPKSFVNALFGHNKFNPSKEMTKVLKNYKANLSPEQYDEVLAEHWANLGVSPQRARGISANGMTPTRKPRRQPQPSSLPWMRVFSRRPARHAL